MAKQRTDRLNSLLREVLSEVVRKELRNPDIPELITVTRVDITRDLRHAKIYISVIGDNPQKTKALRALQSAAGYISTIASKRVVMRYFPTLTFKLDDSADQHLRIEELLSDIKQQKRG